MRALAVWLVCVTTTAIHAFFDPDLGHLGLGFLDSAKHECYAFDGEKQIAQRCVPEFENAAFGQTITASNTCGMREPTDFCRQVNMDGRSRSCGICDNRDRAFAHPSDFLNDFNDPKVTTWWQSETMNDGIQYPNNVTLTLYFGKAFDITYVHLRFVSPRPESFVIFKKTTMDGEWIPWQYYSGSCKSTYKMPERAPILPNNEAVAQCTREFSDISPLTGGDIAFSTLDGRPSAEIFEESEVLHEWVTAVAIRVVFNRLNTFGDEIFGDPRVLKSYYYAVSDFTVGGRCKCNGHAGKCVMSTGEGVEARKVCDCQHNTVGEDCGQCHPFFQDRPWRPATSEDGNECLPCDCNGLSSKCFFDSDLFNRTGHGGHCLGCSGNTHGPHCEQCLPGFFRVPGEHFCSPCGCNEKGSVSQQCDANGQCQCKAGVAGMRCDQCAPGFYDFSSVGCKDCHCEAAGSWLNEPECSAASGDCRCKSNVEGRKCDKCKPGYFNLSPRNQFGCTPCFCFGHSSVCSAADGFWVTNGTSTLKDDINLWRAASERQAEPFEWAEVDNAIAVGQLDDWPVYYHVPTDVLGDWKPLFGQTLRFHLRVAQESTAPSGKDIVITGANGQELYLPITAQNNHLPSIHEQVYRFLLHPQAGGWSPRLSDKEFLKVFLNVTSVRIRATYSQGDVGFLSHFSLPVVTQAPLADSQKADWIEQCTCPEGHVGQFCESCAPGYRRAVKFGGPLTKCIKCDCHGHSDSCDAESGACICQHHTAGDTCETCARGFYGNALDGTPDDCHACDCPEGGACAVLPEGDVVCTECPPGHAGRRCEFCAFEYFGDPLNGRPCAPCPCHDNIDLNEIGNCDSRTGVCLKCIYNTTGRQCERCRSGFFGNATAEKRGDCRECGCYLPGTKTPVGGREPECDHQNGQCVCRPHVTGRDCSECQAGFYNITSGEGCHACDCDAIGSESDVCDPVTGKCKCKPGVTGLKCDQCVRNFYGFGLDGCTACECDPYGAEDSDCDVRTGQCLCRDHVEGRRCDRCSENRHNLQGGCEPCDDCYTLIQKRRDDLEARMAEMEQGLNYWATASVKVEDATVSQRIREVRSNISRLQEAVSTYWGHSAKQFLREFHRRQNQTARIHAKLLAVDPRLEAMSDTLSELEQEVADLKKVRAAYQDNLDKKILETVTEGAGALKRARTASAKLPQDAELTAMALEADRLRQRHIHSRDSVKKLVAQVVEQSAEAYRHPHEAVYGEQVNSKVADLQQLVIDTKSLYNRTRALADFGDAEAQKALDDAAKAVVAANDATLPEDKSVLLTARLDTATNATHAHKQELKRLKEKDASERVELQKALVTARQQVAVLENATNTRQKMLDELERHANKTRLAVAEVAKAVREGEAVLAVIEDFQLNGPNTHHRFVEELALVPDIEADVQKADNKTTEVRETIGDAHKMALSALERAEEARDRAQIVQDVTQELSQALDALETAMAEQETKLGRLAHVVDSLQSAQTALDRSVDLRGQAEVNARKAALAELAARQNRDSINGVEEQLHMLRGLLNSLDIPTTEELAELEAVVKKTTTEYKRNRQRVRKGLKQVRRTRLDRQWRAVVAETDHLERELAQMRLINDALPVKCFNYADLEQTDQ